MTDFIRTILATAAAANANAQAATTTAAPPASQPVNQIQLPPSTAPAAAVAPAPLAVEKLIKVEPVECSALPTPTSDASKAQRAARRDVVNARRDKRKAMASVASPSGHTTGGDSSSDTEDDDMTTAMDDKSKKMKTSATSSVAVAGGLAASESSAKKSFSSSMPPTPGLLFTPEIDAAGEERLRAMEAQLETLDPDSKEAKKKRRLIRNRMSAQLHRERKKAYVGQLEDQLLEKDRELKLLQEKLAQLMAADKSDTKPTIAVAAAATPVAVPVVEAPPAPKDDDVVIKDEPAAWVDAPTWALDAADSWDLHGLEDSEMAELETADLLRDFDDPFAGLLGVADDLNGLNKPHHEIHAAKKNIAMMAAVMFSVSFFGNSPAFYNITPGSNFSSTFSAQGATKDLSQMSIASRIVACLEKTSWKEFRSVSSWIAATNAANDEDDEVKDDEKASVASPSAASDVTSCGSPAGSDADVTLGDTDLIDEFEYPVEDPFGMAAASADWLDDMEKEHVQGEDAAESFLADVMRHEPVVPKQSTTTTKSMTSRLYESLTALWREKQQVLLTVRDDKQQVLQRSVADMSSIRDGLESGHFFTKVFGGSETSGDAAASSEDKSVTFLYPMSAFAGEPTKSLLAQDASVDPVFLEVSCQLNGVAKSMD